MSQANNFFQYLVNNVAKRLNLSKKKGQQPTLLDDDFNRCLRQLWISDTETFNLERDRLELHFLLVLAGCTSTRPGAIIESSSYRNSNRSLHYGHSSLVLKKDTHGGPDYWELRLTLMFRKGDHGGGEKP